MNLGKHISNSIADFGYNSANRFLWDDDSNWERDLLLNINKLTDHSIWLKTHHIYNSIQKEVLVLLKW